MFMFLEIGVSVVGGVYCHLFYLYRFPLELHLPPPPNGFSVGELVSCVSSGDEEVGCVHGTADQHLW